VPAEDEMAIDQRRRYLKWMRERHWAAGRAGRGELLTEMAAVTRLHRKSWSGWGEGRRRVRSRTYSLEVKWAIRVKPCQQSPRMALTHPNQA